MGELAKEKFLISRTLLPAFLLIMPPCLVFILRIWASHCDGELSSLYKHIALGEKCHAPAPSLKDMFLMAGSPFSIMVLAIFISWSLLCQRLLPGKKCTGTITPDGHLPIYKDNGLLSYAMTMITFCLVVFYTRMTQSASITVIYDRFDEILSTLSAFGYIFCLLLYFRGLMKIKLLPQNEVFNRSDISSSGNPIFDYYWGTELYPNLFGLDVKVFTNCRFGMTAWPLLVCIHMLKAYEESNGDLKLMSGLLCSGFLQLAYITKFFYWEAGYYRTLDIILDRAGYYICWGCLVFVPGLYASPTLFGAGAVIRAVRTGQEIIDYRLAIMSAVFGFVFLGANYAADEQRQRVRATNGKTTIWGVPPKLIMAKYTVRNALTKEKKVQTTCLLASGFWGLTRHFNYLVEIGLAFCWCFSNAGFGAFMPFAYFIHLTILLVHRSIRDDEKCSTKYGSAWKEYKDLVPYEMIPGVF